MSRQIVIRIQEAQVAALMDRFVRRVERVALLTEDDGLILLHGTSTTMLLGIKRDGLIEPCLTDNAEAAAYYAQEAVDAVGGEPVVLKVSVINSAKLRADYPSFDEPLVCVYKKWADSEGAFHQLLATGRGGVKWPDNESDWTTSLRVVGSVRYKGVLPVNQLMEDRGDTKRIGVCGAFRRKGGKLQVLLGQRAYDPQAGAWALPAGHCKAGESTAEGARRETKEEVGIEVGDVTFYEKREADDGETAYIYWTLYTGDGEAKASDETKAVKWVDVDDLPELAFDNNKIIPAMAKEIKLEESTDAKAAFASAMQRATAEFVADEKGLAHGGGRPDQRRVADAFDINCGQCEEWGERVRQLYREATGRDDVAVLDPGNLSGDPDASLAGHVFLRFMGAFYDAECPEGVRDWHQLPLFTKQLGEAESFDIKAFIRQQPRFEFKIADPGEYVYVKKSRMGDWPQPIGHIAKDPDGLWFVVSGRVLNGQWKWWDNEFERGERGSVHGPRFDTREGAALDIWLRFSDSKKAKVMRETDEDMSAKEFIMGTPRSWSQISTQEFLASIQSKLDSIGWFATLQSGLVNPRKHLIVMLQPLKPADDFVAIDTLIQDLFPSAASYELYPNVQDKFRCENEAWIVELPTGQTVDFFIRLSAVSEAQGAKEFIRQQ